MSDEENDSGKGSAPAEPRQKEAKQVEKTEKPLDPLNELKKKMTELDIDDDKYLDDVFRAVSKALKLRVYQQLSDEFTKPAPKENTSMLELMISLVKDSMETQKKTLEAVIAVLNPPQAQPEQPRELQPIEKENTPSLSSQFKNAVGQLVEMGNTFNQVRDVFLPKEESSEFRKLTEEIESLKAGLDEIRKRGNVQLTPDQVEKGNALDMLYEIVKQKKSDDQKLKEIVEVLGGRIESEKPLTIKDILDEGKTLIEPIVGTIQDIMNIQQQKSVQIVPGQNTPAKPKKSEGGTPPPASKPEAPQQQQETVLDVELNTELPEETLHKSVEEFIKDKITFTDAVVNGKKIQLVLIKGQKNKDGTKAPDTLMASDDGKVITKGQFAYLYNHNKEWSTAVDKMVGESNG
ncbi:MAG: hypothetical protein QXP38_00570 [Nitrososphaerota archaeon]